MKINLSILCDCLPKEWLTEVHILDLYVYDLEYIAFPDGNRMQNNILYLAEAKDLPSYPIFDNRISILSIGNPSAIYHSDKVNLAVIHPEIQLYDCFNIIQNQFFRFTKWEKEFLSSIYKNVSYDELGRLIYALFDDPVMLYNQSDHLLFNIYDKSNTEQNELFERYFDPNYITAELQITSLEHNFTDNYRLKGPIFVPQHYCKYPQIFFNCFNDKKYCGKLFLTCIRHELTDGRLSKLYLVTDIIQQELFFSELRNPHSDAFTSTMHSLLFTDMQFQSNYPYLLKEVGWKEDDHYLIMYISAENPALSIRLLPTCSLFRVIQPSSYFILSDKTEETCCVLLHLDSISMTKELIINHLSVFCAAHKYTGGFSTIFNDIKKAHAYYLQAHSAYELHYAEHKHKLYDFEQNILRYVQCFCLKEHSMDFYLTNGIQKLRDYDLSHQSDLVHTLKVYLQEEMNITKATNLLHIHRSTLSYRLEQIGRITGLNLKSHTTRAYLRLVFLLQADVS